MDLINVSKAIPGSLCRRGVCDTRSGSSTASEACILALGVAIAQQAHDSNTTAQQAGLKELLIQVDTLHLDLQSHPIVDKK